MFDGFLLLFLRMKEEWSVIPEVPVREKEYLTSNISANSSFNATAWIYVNLGYQTSDHAATYTVS